MERPGDFSRPFQRYSGQANFPIIPPNQDLPICQRQARWLGQVQTTPCAWFPWHSMAITKPVYAEFFEALEARYPNTADRNPG